MDERIKEWMINLKKVNVEVRNIVEGPMADDTIWDFVNGFM